MSPVSGYAVAWHCVIIKVRTNPRAHLLFITILSLRERAHLSTADRSWSALRVRVNVAKASLHVPRAANYSRKTLDMFPAQSLSLLMPSSLDLVGALLWTCAKRTRPAKTAEKAE